MAGPGLRKVATGWWESVILNTSPMREGEFVLCGRLAGCWFAGMDHHVYFWLKEERQGAAERAQYEKALDALFEIPGIIGGRWAVPAKVEIRPVCDQSWDYALDMQFASVADHDAYQAHPAHQAFIQQYRDWWNKVLVTDLA